ncbi:MAG: hypothetical protein NVS2B11_02500 [Acetobacteraceae bacterium]
MPGFAALHRGSRFVSLGLTALVLTATVAAAGQPVACPPEPTRVVRSAGGVIDYLGTVPGVPELCRMTRADGTGDFYFGAWRSDWPGAGQAYPVIRAIVTGGAGARASFITRSWPGLQWTDSFTNEGIEPITVQGRRYDALRLAHEREGIEGNTYHSVITTWRDVATGIALKTFEQQISGQSYGPNTTWQAVRVETLR